MLLSSAQSAADTSGSLYFLFNFPWWWVGGGKWTKALSETVGYPRGGRFGVDHVPIIWKFLTRNREGYKNSTNILSFHGQFYHFFESETTYMFMLFQPRNVKPKNRLYRHPCV